MPIGYRCGDAARVLAADFVIDRRIVYIRFREYPIDGFHDFGAARIHSQPPMGNIIMVANKVHDLTAPVGVVKTPIAMVAGKNIGELFTGAAPKIVVETYWRA